MWRIINLGLIFIFLYIPWFSGGEEIFPRLLIQAIILILSILYLAKRKNFNSLWRKFYISPSLHFPICLILFFSLFSVVNSTYLHNSLLSLTKIVTFVLFYFLLMEHLGDRNILKGNYLFKIIFVSASILAVIAVFQYFLHLEIKATLPTPDFLAGYLTVGITLGIAELLTFRKWSGSNNFNVNIKNVISQNRIPFITYLIPTIIMFITLVLTRSLSGVLALSVAIIFITIFLYKRWAVYAILTIIGIFLIFPSTMKVFQLLGGETLKEFFLQRLRIWSRCLEIISAHPFLGVGPGNFRNFRIGNFPAGYGAYVRFAYNEYLQIGAELGMIVVFLVCSIFYIIVKGVRELLKSSLSLNSQAEVIAASAGALAVLTQGLLYFNLHLTAITCILLFFITKIMVDNHKLFPSPISPGEKLSSLSNLQAPGWLRVASISFLSVLFLLVSVIYLGNHYAYKGEYRKAVKFVPLNAEYNWQLADYYRKEEKQDRTISIYGKIIKLHP
ncbi:MAG: O-antigen ligase family protein, partial [bacterium]